MSKISPEAIQSQIVRITSSSEIGNSPRLKMILNYIVEEFLAGRERYIKGAVIGKEVFDRNGDFDPNTSSTVRVEMGRLRRRLSEYYAGEGKNDPVLISIPKGSYVPAFQLNSGALATSDSPPQKRSSTRSLTPWIVISGIILTLAASIFWLYSEKFTQPGSHSASQSANTSGSANAEALSMFQQAFILLMPPEDNARLLAGQDLFRRVTEIDPQFPGGYAGWSIALSIQIFFIKTEQPEDNLKRAFELGEKAVALNPDYALGYASLALAYALSSDREATLEQARMVVSSRPRDPLANSMTALSLIFIENPLQAIELLREAIRLNPDEPRTPYLNMLGTAYYAARNYGEAATAFEQNIDRGGPSGPHIWVFLAASYVMTGREFEAQAIIEKLSRTDPAYPYEAWIENFVNSPEELEILMGKLRSLGLP